MKKYIVMECHLSYAVVLDESGGFHNVANRHYEVGQTVTDIVELCPKNESASGFAKYKCLGCFAVAVACFVLVTLGVLKLATVPYGSVYVTINPEIRIDVNRDNAVIDVKGINDDGKTLVSDYRYKNKPIDAVVNDIVDRAVEKEYLAYGGEITVALKAKNESWIAETGEKIASSINTKYRETLAVTVEVKHAETGESVYPYTAESEEKNQKLPVGVKNDVEKIPPTLPEEATDENSPENDQESKNQAEPVTTESTEELPEVSEVLTVSETAELPEKAPHSETPEVEEPPEEVPPPSKSEKIHTPKFPEVSAMPEMTEPHEETSYSVTPEVTDPPEEVPPPQKSERVHTPELPQAPEPKSPMPHGHSDGGHGFDEPGGRR